MKFKVKGTELSQAMGKIVTAVPVPKAKAKEPSVAFIVKKLPQGEALACVGAYDGKKQFASSFRVYEVEMENDNEIFYPDAKKIRDISGALSEKAEFIEIKTDEKCVVKGGGTEASFGLGDEVTLLPFGETPKQSVVVKTNDFARLVRIGGKFYCRISKKVISCVCLQFSPSEGTVTMVSSDGYRIGIAEAKAEFKIPEQEDTMYIIDGDQFKEVVHIIGDDNATFGLYDNKLLVKMMADVSVFLTRDDTDSYPFMALKATDDSVKTKATVQVSVAEIAQSLTIFNIINDDKDPFLLIKWLNKDTISFQTKSGAGKTDINVKMQGVFEEIALNAKFFGEAISVFGKSTDIYISIGAPNLPVILKQHPDSKDKVVLLPLANPT